MSASKSSSLDSARTVGLALDLVERRKNELGQRFPRCLVVLAGELEQLEELCATVERIPARAGDVVSEVALLLRAPEDDSTSDPRLEALRATYRHLRVLRDPRAHGYGARRKVAFEYALQQGFDFVAALEPAPGIAATALPELLAPALLEDRAVVLGGSSRSARGGSALINGVLDLRVRDYAAPWRVYSCEVLQRVPFHLNSDGRGFDTELLIQCRALGLEPAEVELEGSLEAAGFSAAESLGLAIGYRLHQLHVTRRGQYFVDRDVHYTFKHSPSSSHMQVLEAIRPGSLVLDLGCSQGLLAAPLKQRGVRVIGVDSRDPKTVSLALEAYYQRDLEQPLELPEGRVFDYVVCADVIEHVINREELLRGVRRYLKPDGRLLISTPNIAIWFYRLSLLAGRFEYGPRGVLDQTHVHLFTRATFRREVENAAFRVLRERVTSLPFEIVFESTGRSRAVRALSAAYHACARAWPEMFAYQFLLEAEVGTLLDSARAP